MVTHFVFCMVLILSLSACAPAMRMDVTCIARSGEGQVIMNCADQQTWKEWREKQIAPGQGIKN